MHLNKALTFGFTGTREGLVDDQRIELRRWLDKNRPYEARHGACVGADEQFVTMVAGLCTVIAHPPLDESKLSQYAMSLSDVHASPKEYLERNRDIVDLSGLLLACPKGEEEQRSGTWSTIRYCRTKHPEKRIVIFWPDGRTEENRNG